MKMVYLQMNWLIFVCMNSTLICFFLEAPDYDGISKAKLLPTKKFDTLTQIVPGAAQHHVI